MEFILSPMAERIITFCAGSVNTRLPTRILQCTLNVPDGGTDDLGEIAMAAKPRLIEGEKGIVDTLRQLTGQHNGCMMNMTS